ncbi:MAG: 2,3-bisphosphoglycerate-independent phosphoglycerate mutase [Nitrospirota bacterium]|nr:2,3-bisphosphoglycerate-independent phosphoglycerate mutase [Nitrospirota bacterium]MDP2381834.1 2,3-bisphosphoglycerate-independent phosphoglycerate mutase [Nitrospirota bacterium]MDP3595684.1 2,3-bisphosphoglycerate-independent phosphoglycerate mutase [Nitrospirota bacterium]
MKYVILHADGMADHSRQELGGRTPLQVASTPHLDRLAQAGELGLLASATEPHRRGSGLMGTAILGYDPKKYYQGPGPFEAASLGVAVGEQDVAYRCTMVTLRADMQSGSKGGLNEIKKLGPHVVMDDATAGLISTEEARELIEAINEQLGSEMIQFYPGLGHRHLMVWGNGKSRAVCTDPQLLVGRPIADALPTGEGADFLWKLMDASFQILRDHPLNEERSAAGQKPANCLWLWGEGRAVFWPSLSERFKMAGVVVSQSDVHRGLGSMAGLEVVDGSRLAGADLRTQATVVLEELVKKDFAYIHVELPDEVLYGSDVAAKVKAIETVDRELVGPLLEGLSKLGSHRIVAFCDSGNVPQGQAADGSGFFAYCDSTVAPSGGAGRRFIEADAQASAVPPRDATKFIVRLFAKGS